LANPSTAVKRNTIVSAKEKNTRLLVRIKEVEGEAFDADIASCLMEASLNGKKLEEFEPEPHWSEVNVSGQVTAVTPTNEQFAVGRAEKLIWDKVRNGDSCADLLLQGWVCQFWLKEVGSSPESEKARFPTVARIAELIGISRSKFYRWGCRAGQIKLLYNRLNTPK
jgi:hypothetical protein